MGSVETAGDITTNDHSITFTSPITLTGNVSDTVNGSSGGILFSGSSASINGGYDLVLNASNGTV